ncbi:MAG TPA: cytochrome P450 [Dermatophilaceae bacterium]|nr:cytochrome P450 [Dermatophilaceae bacterium]
MRGPTLFELVRRNRAIRDDPVAFLAECALRYGDVVALPSLGPPVLLLNDPQEAARILRSAGWTKNTVQYAALAAVTGSGLLAASDDGWLARRRTAQPAFHQARLGGLTEVVREAARTEVAGWDRRGPGPWRVDVVDLGSRLSLDVIGRTLFGADLAGQADRLVRATQAAARLVVEGGWSVVLPGSVPTPARRARARAVAELDAVSADLIGRRRRRGVGPHDGDLLGVLLAAGWPDSMVRDELVTMVVAGHETVAVALAWTLMLLAEEPSAQRRLGQDSGWARACVDEALRLYPPGWVLSRRSRQATTVAGRRVPAGTVVIVSPWVLHRDPRAWPDPTAFRPVRFADATARHTTYLPFGLGPRQCIGRDFALVQLTVLVAELLRDHQAELPTGFARPRLDAFATLHPRGGMDLLVSRRAATR